MSEKSASKELIVNILVFGIGTVGSKIIMFILLPIYTIYLTTSELGVAELVVNYMNFLYPIASINIMSAMLRYSMDEEQDKRRVLQNAVFVVCAGVIVISLIMSLIHTGSAVEDWKPHLIIMLFVYSMQQVLSTFAKALDQTKICTVGNLIYTGALLGFSIIFLALLHMGTMGYLISMIAANLVSILYYCFALKILRYVYFGRPDGKLLLEMILFALPLMVESLSGWIATFCDRFVLEYFMGTESVGIYSVASKLPSLIAAFASVFMSAWVLSAIKEYEAGSDRTFSNQVFRKFSAVFMAWAAFVIYICKWLMMLLARGDFSESWKYAPLLLCSAVFGGFGNFFAAFFTSAKKNTSLMISTLLGAVINMVTNIILIPIMGIQGATLTTMLSQLIVFVYRAVCARSFVKIEINYKKLTAAILLVVAESAAVVLEINMVITAIPAVVVLLLYYNELKEIIVIVNEKMRGIVNRQ